MEVDSNTAGDRGESVGRIGRDAIKEKEADWPPWCLWFACFLFLLEQAGIIIVMPETDKHRISGLL